MHFPNRFRKTIEEDVAAFEPAEDGQGFARKLTPRAQVRILALAVAGIVAVLAISAGVEQTRAYFARRNAAPEAKTIPGTFKPSPKQLQSLTVTPVAAMDFRAEEIAEGHIAIDDDLTTPVFSPYSGRVASLGPKVGDVVAKGAPLMTVAASEFVQTQSDLVSAAAAAEAARSQLATATFTEKRLHDLYDIKGAALKDWQQAQSDLAAADSAARAAAAALAAARGRMQILGKTSAEIDALIRDGHSLAAAADATLSAPIAGTVIQRQVGIGQYIQSGSGSPVYTIGDLSKVWLVADVRENDAALVHVGQMADVRVPAFPGRVFHARLTTVGPGVDPNTHRLPVRAEIDNPDGALKPQMFASFSIATGDAHTAPGVPESAIIAEGDTARVWVANADDSLGLREIHTGHTQGGMVEITEGLNPGEKIVTSGSLFVDQAAKAD